MDKNAVSSRRNCVDTELHASVNDIIRCKEPCPVSVNAHLAKLILTVRQHNGKSIRNNARHVIILAHSALRDARVGNGNRENHRHYKKHKTPLPHKNTINLFHVANLVNLSTHQTRKTKFFKNNPNLWILLLEIGDYNVPHRITEKFICIRKFPSRITSFTKNMHRFRTSPAFPNSSF